MAQTKYAIFKLEHGGDAWKPLGHGMGSTPQQAARDFFSQAEEQPKDGEGYIAVPSSNIHPLPVRVETQTRLTFG
jgi:hypothetical protein